MTALEIRVPALPPASSSPNSRAHWSVRRREAEDFKQMVCESVLMAGVLGKPLKHPILELEFIVAQHRRHDADNTLARFKPGLDSLVQMGLLKDDNLDYLEVRQPVFTVDKEQAPLTIIRLREREPEPNENSEMAQAMKGDRRYQEEKDKRLKALGKGAVCPCTIVEPCSKQCSCAYPRLSQVRNLWLRGPATSGSNKDSSRYR